MAPLATVLATVVCVFFYFFSGRESMRLTAEIASRPMRRMRDILTRFCLILGFVGLSGCRAIACPVAQAILSIIKSKGKRQTAAKTITTNLSKLSIKNAKQH